MVVQLLMGGVTGVCNIALHAVLMTAVITATRAAAVDLSKRPLPLIQMMVATVSILMVAHTLEVIVWAAVYWVMGAAPADANLLYFAFVNYTTLGYGDITHVQRWQLLGPMTAMNGILLFGWSTAVIFEVLRKTLVQIESIGRQS